MSLAACDRGPTEPPEEGPVPLLSAISTSACAVDVGGTTYCWGQQSLAGSGFWATPRVLALPAHTGFSRGSSGGHLCVVSADGTGTCWGRMFNGQLGRPLSSFPQPAPVSGGIEWAEITVGRLSSCGVSRTGVGYCWGSNNAGEIGTETVGIGVNTFTPTAIDGSLTFKSVVAGWRHACGITTSGEAYCWGENTHGQLGIGGADLEIRRTPVRVSGSNTFVELSLGGRHSCGLATDGRALCWGDNSAGQLGDGTLAARSIPTPIAGNLKFRSVVTSGGIADSAGVPLPNVPQGSAAHTCGLTTTGVAYCWGWSAAGQVGNPAASVFQITPIAVSGGLTFQALAVGGAFSCGARQGTVWCWGSNVVGQLGNGGIARSVVPGPVAAPFGSAGQ